MSAQSPNPNPHDDPTPAPVVFYGLLGFIGLVASVVALEWLAYSWGDTGVRAAQVAALPVQAARVEQESQMTRPAWIDKNAGVVKVPIQRAMELVAKEVSADPNAASPPATQPAASVPAPQKN